MSIENRLEITIEPLTCRIPLMGPSVTLKM